MGTVSRQSRLRTHTRRKSMALASVLLSGLGMCAYSVWWPAAVNGYSNYVPIVPNSNVNSCNTCHGPMGPGSATSNNQFKADFAANNHTWTAALAAKDSDGDGFTDGEELQDPAGTYTSGSANPGNSALVSSPSDVNSTPPAPTMTAVMGVSANSNASGAINLSVALSTAKGGTPVGITHVDYVFKTAGTNTVINTFSSTTGAAYAVSVDTKTLANQAYDITATCYDKRSALAGGARTASVTISNVTIANAPIITTQPISATVAPGGTASFTVAASGATSYQWQKSNANVSNGGNYSGATTTTLTITGAAAADAAIYNCIVTNAAGSTSSSTATLTVGSQTSNSYVKLVSATPSGASGDLASSVPPTINGTSAVGPTNRTISTDGRIIVFRSTADNLIAGSNPNNLQNCFARDLKLGTTQLISANTSGQVSGNKFSDTVIVSADGHFAAFNSSATDLTAVQPTTLNATHVYRRDLQAGITIPVGVRDGVTTTAADYGTSNTNVQCISQDGRYIVVFYDGTTQYDPSKAFNSSPNLYQRDCTNNSTTLITVNSAGTGTHATGGFSTSAAAPVMTPDGRFVVFTSDATDVGPVTGNGFSQVYLWDQTSPNSLILVSAVDGSPGTGSSAVQSNQGSFNPSISSDGRYISFESASTNLNINHTTGTNTVVYRRDVQTDKTDIVSQAASSLGAGTGSASGSTISANGQYVVYVSTDSNLVTATDNNTYTDIFRRDMNDTTTAKNIVVSAPNGTNAFSSTGASQNARASDDGRYVVFESNATDFVGAIDSNSKTDVFRRDCQTQSTILLSIKSDLTGSSSGASQNPFVSGNGLTAEFESDGPDLVSNDVNGTALDIFSATFNVAPTVAALTNASVVAGQPFSQSGSFTDPNGPDSFTATADYGDGNGPQSLTVTGNNTFVLNNTYSKPGQYTVLVSVTDSANGVGMASAKVTVLAATAAPTLVSSANPAGFNQSIMFTTTVAGTAGLPAPTGVVTINDGNVAVGSAPLVTANNITTATVTLSTLSNGTHPITAVYSGDANYASSTSANLNQVINPSLPTITSPLTATVAINAQFSYQITATGSPPFTYSVQGLPAGLTFDTDTISGSVSAGGLFTIKLTATNVAGPISQNLTLTVPGAIPATTLVSSANPGFVNQPITFTATVASAGGFPAPTGMVTFQDNGTTVGSISLTAAGGSATSALSLSTLAVGSHPLTAIYSGDANYVTSTSSTLTQTINAGLPPPPTITSASTATIAVNTQFTYQITSTGAGPITYAASGLPAGFTFNVDTISGSVSSGGMITINLSATNAGGTSNQSLLLTVTRPASGDSPPAITSAASATPNPASTGSVVTFTAAATDPDNDFISYLWDFGDGTTGSGISVTHVYAVAGTFTVKLSVTDSVLATPSAVTVVVTTSSNGGGTGGGGSGGGGNGGGGTAFTASKGALKFTFNSAAKDSFSLMGSLPLGAGFNPDGKSAQLIIGNFTDEIDFDAKGKSALKLAGKKAKDGSFSDASLKFSLSLTKQNIYSSVSGLGFVGDTGKSSVNIKNIEVILVIGGNAYFTTLTATYKATKGKTGTATLTP